MLGVWGEGVWSPLKAVKSQGCGVRRDFFGVRGGVRVKRGKKSTRGKGQGLQNIFFSFLV